MICSPLIPSPEPEPGPHSGLQAPAPAHLWPAFLLMPLSAVTDNFSSTLEVTITINKYQIHIRKGLSFVINNKRLYFLENSRKCLSSLKRNLMLKFIRLLMVDVGGRVVFSHCYSVSATDNYFTDEWVLEASCHIYFLPCRHDIKFQRHDWWSTFNKNTIRLKTQSRNNAFFSLWSLVHSSPSSSLPWHFLTHTRLTGSVEALFARTFIRNVKYWQWVYHCFLLKLMAINSWYQ